MFLVSGVQQVLEVADPFSHRCLWFGQSQCDAQHFRNRRLDLEFVNDFTAEKTLKQSNGKPYCIAMLELKPPSWQIETGAKAIFPSFIQRYAEQLLGDRMTPNARIGRMEGHTERFVLNSYTLIRFAVAARIGQSKVRACVPMKVNGACLRVANHR
jgi:hypothetical protein